MFRRAMTMTAVASAALAALPAASHAAPKPRPVVEWNHFLLDLQATPGNQPATIHPTYELAIVHEAIDDAVRAVPSGAAADAAARDTLVALYPALKKSIDQQYDTLLAREGGGVRTLAGVAAGRRAARLVLQARAGDGSAATPPPFVPGTGPGEYQLTPPGFAAPVFTHWGRVRPFILRSGAQFRPPAPNATKSVAALEEVRALGAATGSTRTADQTQIGLFWNPPIWATWNRIAETAALGHDGDLVDDARTFAALNVTFADSVIAFYDAKYAYHVWRPVTAIRATSDPTWTPLSNTAPDPSYPGAHGTISAAAADVLAASFGNRFDFTVDSTALPGVTRGFTSFSEAAEEASESRIFNGNHTRVDQVAGENLGHDVAGLVLKSLGRRPFGG